MLLERNCIKIIAITPAALIDSWLPREENKKKEEEEEEKEDKKMQHYYTPLPLIGFFSRAVISQ